MYYHMHVLLCEYMYTCKIAKSNVHTMGVCVMIWDMMLDVITYLYHIYPSFSIHTPAETSVKRYKTE